MEVKWNRVCLVWGGRMWLPGHE